MKNSTSTGTRRGATLAALAALATLTTALNSPAVAQGQQPGAWNQAQAVQESLKRMAAGKDPIPGPRDCFWLRGPAGPDPYINIAYPDAATFYWAAVFTVPPGAKLRLEGRFPQARYMSLISYDSQGRPIESIADYLIKPKAGSRNPFLPNADRTTTQRDWALDIVENDPPPNLPVGMNLVGSTRDKLHAPKFGGAAQQQTILYRIYVRDNGTDEAGNAGLPQPVLTMGDGKEVRGAAACQALRTRQPLAIDPAAMALPMDKYYELREAAAKKGPNFPATNPPTWYQQFDREALYGIYTGEPPKENARKSEGGFYPNLDNQYIRTIVNRRLGKVFVLRAKAPTTPRTIQGDKTFGGGDLRYWSWCSNQGFANTRVNDCVHDEMIPVGPDGFYTIVVSRIADRPRSATLQCGVAWLPMADDGDGSGDPDMTVLQLRHMLGAGEFKNAVHGIRSPATILQDMGAYAPQGRYISTSAFETALPCLVEKR